MIKSPTSLTRRSIFRAGVGLAVAATATPLLIPASAREEGANQAGAEPLNGDGFYRFPRTAMGRYRSGRSSLRTSLKLNSLRC